MVPTFWVILSLIVGWFGKDRRFGFLGSFLASLVLSPLVVLLILILTQPRPILPRRAPQPAAERGSD